MVKLYTQPSCRDCVKTKKEFKRKGIEYEEIDLSQDKTAREMIKKQGFMKAPVVITEGDSWSGFKPQKIAGMVQVDEKELDELWSF